MGELAEERRRLLVQSEEQEAQASAVDAAAAAKRIKVECLIAEFIQTAAGRATTRAPSSGEPGWFIVGPYDYYPEYEFGSWGGKGGGPNCFLFLNCNGNLRTQTIAGRESSNIGMDYAEVDIERLRTFLAFTLNLIADGQVCESYGRYHPPPLLFPKDEGRPAAPVEEHIASRRRWRKR